MALQCPTESIKETILIYINGGTQEIIKNRNKLKFILHQWGNQEFKKK